MIKNILTLSIVACACGAASAQSESSVNLYGSVDAGLSRVTGLKGGTDNKVVSGIMDGSRWGLRGNEVIGNGFRGIFTLESRLEVNNGTLSNRPASGSQVPDRFITAATAALAPIPLAALPAATRALAIGAAAKGVADKSFGVNVDPPNAVFDRQAFVGLVTPVGAVLVGRQYTPAYEVAATFDTLQTQSSLAAGQVASFPPSIDIRVSNALAYRFEKGPFSGGLMYTVEPAPSVTTLKGLSFMYKTEPVSVGLGYNTHKNELGEKALTSTVVGAMVKIGPGYLSGLLGKIKDDHPTGLSAVSPGLVAAGLPKSVGDLVQNAFIGTAKQDARLSHIGYRLTAGASTVYVAYTSYNDKLPNNADTASYGAVYSYALSKRTDLSAVVTRFNNKGTGQAAPGAAGYLGGVTEKAGIDSSNVAFGLRHRF